MILLGLRAEQTSLESAPCALQTLPYGPLPHPNPDMPRPPAAPASHYLRPYIWHTRLHRVCLANTYQLL